MYSKTLLARAPAGGERMAAMRMFAVLGALALLALSGAGCDDAGDDPEPPTPSGDDDDDATEEPLYDDADGDGVPDVRDRCPDTGADRRSDPRGCSARQAAGCDVVLTAPADGEILPEPTLTFTFGGDCEGYRLYVGPEPGLRPHAAAPLGRLSSPGAFEVDHGDLPSAGEDGVLYWAVEGSGRGHTFLSDIRSFVGEAP